LASGLAFVGDALARVEIQSLQRRRGLGEHDEVGVAERLRKLEARMGDIREPASPAVRFETEWAGADAQTGRHGAWNALGPVECCVLGCMLHWLAPLEVREELRCLGAAVENKP
jgi:hypothetical protein